jgi:deoxyhypusine synthase
MIDLTRRERGVRDHSRKTKNGCGFLYGSPKNFTCRVNRRCEVRNPKGGEFFIQITTDQVVWGGLSAPRHRRRLGAR